MIGRYDFIQAKEKAVVKIAYKRSVYYLSRMSMNRISSEQEKPGGI